MDERQECVESDGESFVISDDEDELLDSWPVERLNIAVVAGHYQFIVVQICRILGLVSILLRSIITFNLKL